MLHLHFTDGELVRTTPEHPFWVKGAGWVAAGALKAGDQLATLSGEWVALREVYDTEQWEPVYNVRVANTRTYFVGDEDWGFALWAHNTYKPLSGLLVAEDVKKQIPNLITQQSTAIINAVRNEAASTEGWRKGLAAVGQHQTLVNVIVQAINSTETIRITDTIRGYFNRENVQAKRIEYETRVRAIRNWNKYI